MRTSFVVACLLLVACGSNPGGASGDGGNGGDGGANGDGGNGPDAEPHPDGMVPVDCVPGSTQCNNCVDDDRDGNIDGFDIECTGLIDDDEDSFATGINGDNMDLVNQDCFFDGNSGAGDDRCNRHVCCLLGLTEQACDDGGYDSNFDPVADCPVQDADCIGNCGGLTPPGCDCFGCCTVCDAAGCVDIYINPVVAPNCDDDSIHDPGACPVCEPSVECGSECPIDTSDCILCPGEDESALDPSCTATECPGGATVCAGTSDCGPDEFCSSGCCIFVVN